MRRKWLSQSYQQGSQEGQHLPLGEDHKIRILTIDNGHLPVGGFGETFFDFFRTRFTWVSGDGLIWADFPRSGKGSVSLEGPSFFFFPFLRDVSGCTTVSSS
jgi:hypothetical protein